MAVFERSQNPLTIVTSSVCRVGETNKRFTGVSGGSDRLSSQVINQHDVNPHYQAIDRALSEVASTIRHLRQLSTMPQTILDAIARHTVPPPPAASPDAKVFHSRGEYVAIREESRERYFRCRTEVVNGTICKVHKNRSEVAAAWAPPLNALCLPNYGRWLWTGVEEYVPDHTFTPREPQPDDGTGSSPVKKAYAMCQGCFDRGWHREETDVSALAFGLDPSILPEYPPPRLPVPGPIDRSVGSGESQGPPRTDTS